MASTLTMDPRNNALDWANSAYLALEGTDYTSPSKWTSYEERPSQQTSFASIPPSLLTQQSIERHGQVTPPDDLSPANFALREFDNRESSIPLEQLQPEPSWPSEQAATAQDEQTQDRPNKRRRTTSKASSTKQPTKQAKEAAPPAEANPPKRRRGRPKNPTNISSNSNGSAMSANSPPSANRNNHLEKNRQAAYKCRQKKKQYINNLETRAREFAATNAGLREHVAVLREEVLVLKNEVLRHAGCGFWAVDEYLARCAGGLLGAPEGYGEMMAMGTPVNLNDLGPMPDLDEQQQDTEDETKPRKDSGIADVEDCFGDIKFVKEANDAANAQSQAAMARTGG